jgi:hypothetical protein
LRLSLSDQGGVRSHSPDGTQQRYQRQSTGAALEEGVFEGGVSGAHTAFTDPALQKGFSQGRREVIQ